MSRRAAEDAAVEAVLERLRREGIEGIWVDRAPVFDKTTLLHALYQSLRLPAWFGFNWDALEDCLSELHTQPPRALVFRDFALLEERDPESARTFMDIVQTAAAQSGAFVGLVHADQDEKREPQ